MRQPGTSLPPSRSDRRYNGVAEFTPPILPEIQAPLTCVLAAPGQEFAEPRGQVAMCEPVDDVGKVGFRVEAVQLCCLDQGVEDGVREIADFVDHQQLRASVEYRLAPDQT